MRVLGIIPARAGSKRLPRKNVRPLGGKPLIAWAIELQPPRCRIDRLVVSSDDDEVLEIAARYDAELPLRRPAEFAQDCSPPLEYVIHALKSLEGPSELAFDAVTIIQASSPLTLPADIDAVIDLLFDTGAESAVSVVQVCARLTSHEV